MPEKIKLLVPFNFSEKSEQALDFALTYSRGVPAEIYIFYVSEGSSKDFRTADRLNEENVERMKQAVMNALTRMQQAGIAPAVEDVHRRLAHGKAASEILKMSEGIGADMIIMGAPSRSAFKKLTTQTPCTLVLVKTKTYA